ncbi:DUF2674 domain-containing protein [Patescibacteria group bacterium]|nr:DUF2674 domain-containing protein [Patescibacteria group bacterium]
MKLLIVTIKPEIPITGIEGGVAGLNDSDIRQMNEHLENGWLIREIVPNHKGAILVVLEKD